MHRDPDLRAAAPPSMNTEQRIELLDFILDSTSEFAIVATNHQGTIVAWNEGARRIYGVESAEILGRPVSILLNDSRGGSADRALKLLDAAHATGRWSGEIKRRALDGRPMVTHVTIVKRRGAKGEDLGFMLLARDLTLEKQIQNAMREQAAYTRNLFESNIDAQVTTDTEGIITDLNRQMSNLTGFSREELIGTLFSDYSTEPARAAEGIRRVLADERLTDYELTIRHRSGQGTPVAYNAAVMRGADERPRGVFAAARDITATKTLEDQLRRKNDQLREQNRRVEQANRLKTEFLANMSHELRTPLNAMIGFAEIVYDRKAGPLTADQQEYLGDILTSARHLLRLINDVLDLAKIESGKMEFQPEPINLMAIVAEVRDILRSIAAAKRVTVVTEIDRSIGTLLIDPGKLKQVFYNFLSNALKFTPDGGRVTIRASRDGEKDFLIEIEDTGIGISDDDMKRLFVEFQQLDASIAKKYQGTGLGLALTKRIVEAQSGTVGVRSTPGIGSVFWARLPREHRLNRRSLRLAAETAATGTTGGPRP